jgi:site-specific DNA-methyltransferase (adenine-specific)
LRDAIVDAFYATHDGYSIDWLLASPPIQTAFQEACRDAGLIGSPTDWNRELLRLRKSGGFPKRGDIRKVHISTEEIEAYGFAAEIAWRLSSEKFGGVSLDEIYCDADKATYFDRQAQRFAPGFEPAQYRWAALRLRKASSVRVGEMKKYDFIVRTRDFRRALNWHRCDFDRYNGKPAIYSLLADDRSHVFLDRAENLGRRLVQHASCSVFQKKVQYLSIIPVEELMDVRDYQIELRDDLVRRHCPELNMTLSGLLESLAS